MTFSSCIILIMVGSVGVVISLTRLLELTAAMCSRPGVCVCVCVCRLA
jgi:hypothetical protein